MTNSQTNTVPNTTSRLNAFTGIARRKNRFRLLPANGDGSTLTLDFTTGVLDPRLSFTRASEATFINSSGLVQYADANMVVNSVMSGPATPTGWSLVSGGAGATIPSTGVRRLETTTAAQNWIQNISNYSTAQGLLYSTTAVITAVSGQHYQNTMCPTGGSSVVQFYRNGVAVAGPSGGSFQTAQTGVITCVWQASSSSGNGFRIGVGSTGSNVANGVCEFSELRTVPGSYPIAPYFANTNTANPYQAPRFDYDPTTMAPRGLLVEGASTNLCEQGQYCWGNGATQAWARSAQVHVNSVNGAAGANNVPRIDGPDGGSLTGTSLFKDSGSTFVRTNINVAVAQLTTYTFSVYVRAPSGGNPYMRLAAFNGGTWLNTTGDTTASGITITNTAGSGSRFNGVPSTAWVRIWVTFTTQALQTSATIAFYPDADTSNAATMYVWGAQVEAGSGPSSVILTGASTATRNEDSATMAISAAQLGFDLYRYTMRVRGRQNKFAAASSFARSLRLHDASTEQVGLPVSNNTLYGTSRNVSNNAIAEVSVAATLNQDFRFAWALNADLATNTMLGSLNQSPLSASRTATGPMGSPTTLSFNTNTSPTSNFASMTIRDVKFWPRQMTASELNALTAP